MSNLILLGENNTPEVLDKASITLDNIYSKAISIQNNCTDINVGESTINHLDSFNSSSGELSVITSYSDYRILKMSKHSIGQLCQKLGMNMTYFNTCYEKEAFELLDYNMNYWISEAFNKELMLRLYYNNDLYVRGVLSNRYSKFDTPQILEKILGTVNLSDYEIKGYYLSPERFHLRFTLDRKLLADDDLFPGFTIDSSDVGRSALYINFFIYKQVCTNGLCVPQISSKYSQRHLGIKPVDFVDSVTGMLNQVQDLSSKAVDLINYSKSVTIPIQSINDNEFEDFLDIVSRKTLLGKDTITNKVVPLMTEKYGSTAYGLVNAITEVAQDYTLEKRLDLESKAGVLLSYAVA